MINDFEHREHIFEVPLRIASAKGCGWDILRVIPPAIMTGQAAAETASQALREERDVLDVNIKTPSRTKA